MNECEITITTTVRKVKRLTLTEQRLREVILAFLDLDPNAEVDFDIRQGSYLAGCTITEITTTTEEAADGEG